MTGVALRTARRDEIDTMLDLAAEEGWNPGLDDAAAFHAADPEGFFVAEHRSGIVAAISVVNHSADMAFLGLYICAIAFRGRGIGRALWDHAIAHSGSRCVGLDGVAAQEFNYAKSGFVRAGASRRFAGSISAARTPEIREARPRDAQSLAVLDRAASGFDRPDFLGVWTSATQTRRTVLSKDGRGYATIRRCREGCKIGPVVAPDCDAALRLARAATAVLPSELIYIDLSSESRFEACLCELGFEETFATARMYRGAPPSGNGCQVAIASMELG